MKANTYDAKVNRNITVNGTLNGDAAAAAAAQEMAADAVTQEDRY